MIIKYSDCPICPVEEEENLEDKEQLLKKAKNKSSKEQELPEETVEEEVKPFWVKQ